MEQLKTKILNMIAENKKGYFDLKKLAAKLKMTKTSDFVMLNKALNQLEDDFLIVRNSQNYFMTIDQAGMYQGTISLNKKGFGFVDIDEKTSFYINARYVNGAMDKDKVLIQVLEGDEAKVLKVVERNSDNLIATVVGKNLSIRLDDARYRDYRLSVVNRKDFNLVRGLKLQLKVVQFKDPLKVEIVRVIGHENDPGVDISSILLANDIKLEFDQATLDEANAIPQQVELPQMLKRKDLSKRTIVTIDGDDSKDFDDAISIQRLDDGFLLGVHIADVSAYVKEGSPLDKEAYTRGTSVYVCDRVVPMLPHVLSNGICSLNPGVDRLCISVDMKIDRKGEIVDYELYPSIICSNQRMTYNNVNKILAGDPRLQAQYQALVPMFFDMVECANLIRKRRVDNGAIEFDTDEAYIIVDKKGKPVDIKLRDCGISQGIIEDFMICANECVARIMKFQNLPCIYRIHESPKMEKLKEFALIAKIRGHKFKGDLANIRPLDIQKCLDSFTDEQEHSVLSTLMLRCMQKARYDANCVGHFGLASKEYLHFTSPIRRYPDLIVHRMIRKYIFEQNYDDLAKDEKMVDDAAMQASEREDKATYAERDVVDMKKAEYMQNFVGQYFDGIISSVTNFGFFVKLDNTVEGLVHVTSLSDDHYTYIPTMMCLQGKSKQKRYTLGDKVRIKVIGANKEEGTVDFKVVVPRKKRKQVWM
ncbi:MAG: ribonuclease R [Erysipelotrichaceae bacterium]|nr:ribonuclease R [Erysipelotrichaceae bacterium]MDY5252828.1 ribonuclease R [Erysipelotrichaceae bacterium]